MKKSIIILGISTFVSLISFAQTNKSVPSKSETVKMKTEALKREASIKSNMDDSKYMKSLGLTDEKIQDAQKIMTVYKEKSASVSASDLSQTEKQKLLAEYELKRTSTLKNIMGEANYNKFLRHQASRAN